MRVYIAGPYTADTEEERLANTLRAIDAGIEVYKLGHIPYIPHLSHWMDKRAKETGHILGWYDYMEMGIEWLSLCDAFIYLDSSKGADIELYYAVKELDLKVYTSVEGFRNDVLKTAKDVSQ